MIDKLEILLLKEQLFKNRSDEQEILDLTSDILAHSFNSFQQYRENIIAICKVFGKTENTSLQYLITLFSNNYDYVTKHIMLEKLIKFDDDQKLDSFIQEKIFQKFEAKLKLNNNIRLSQFKVDLSEISKSQQKSFLG